MTVLQSLRILRRWRSVVLAGALIGIVVGWVTAPGTSGTVATFRATNTLILAPGSDFSSLTRAVALARFGAVPDRVAARLGGDRPRLQSMISLDTPAGQGTLLITGRSADRAQAEALANVTAEELVVELGGPASPLHTLEPAVASQVDSGSFRGPASHLGRGLLLGAFGLVLGMGATFVLDRFDDRVRSKATAEDALGAPVLSEVPAIGRADRGRLLTSADHQPFIEEYRRLRTEVLQWASRPGKRDGQGAIVVVASTTGGEGTTTTVAHLAATLGEIGRSVVVISADVRRPQLHLYFDKPREPGLTDVLRGAPDVRRITDINSVTTVRGVRFIPSGAPVRNPAALLDRIGDPLQDAREMADFVLVDAPALLTTSDTAGLARHADGVLMVLRSGWTSVRSAARSAELLDRLDVEIVGAVLVGSEASRA